MTRPFFIDTDTASDDAVALVIALNHPEVDVVGIGVVAGNVPLDAGVQNALYTRELCGRLDVPVYVGEAAPLKLPLITAQNVHGIRRHGRHRPRRSQAARPTPATPSTPCCRRRTTTPAS